jgi:hypothetical protein
MLILILIFLQPSLVWLRITFHYCYNAWRLLWFDHGSSPHLRKTTQNYGKGGAGIYGLRRLGMHDGAGAGYSRRRRLNDWGDFEGCKERATEELRLRRVCVEADCARKCGVDK